MRIELRTGTRVSGSGYERSASGFAMVRRIFLLVPGVFLIWWGLTAYKLLDQRLITGIMLSGFLIPAVAQVVSFVRDPQSNGGIVLRWIFGCSSVCLVLLGLLLFANGALDRSPAQGTKATVLQKAAVQGGRYGQMQYYLFVSSWRPGVAREQLIVSLALFNQAGVGKAVTVETHAGYLGLSWYERIASD
jgi:hypothetical protein